MEANLRPIPPPRDDDNEDVHWTLSTANALWARGEREEALRWLRRAAEHASDANADMRALELFKAAADVASRMSASAPPPPPPPARPSAQPRPQTAADPEAGRPRPPTGAPPARPPAPIAAGPAPTAARTPSAAPPQGPSRSASAAPQALRSEPPAVRRQPPAPPPQPIAAQPAPARQPTAAQPARGAAEPAARQPSARPPARTAAQHAPPVGHERTQAAQAAQAQAQAPQVQGAQQAPQVQGAQQAPQGGGRRSKSPRVVTQIGIAPPAAALQYAAQRAAYPAEPSAQAQAQVDAARLDAARYAQEAAQALAGTAIAGAGAPALPADGAMHAPQRIVWTDDEVTMQRDLSALQREQELAAALARQHPELTALRGDDLDEDTRVLDGASRTEQPPPAASPDSDGSVAGETMVEAGLLSRGVPAAARADAAGEVTDASGQGSAQDPWAGSADPARWHAPAALRGPGPQVEALPAMRVAVLATSAPGEVRLVLLDARSEPPTGAAAAILVPLSGGDGEAIAKLFSGG